MNITICALPQAHKLAPEYDYIISCLDPQMRKKGFAHLGDNHLIVYFEDTEHPSDIEYIEMHIAIRRILDWIKSKRIDETTRILIHCHAGVSRSAAIAWLIAMSELGMEPVKAFEELYSKRTQIWPNTMVMSIGETILKPKNSFMPIVFRINAEISTRRSSHSSGYCN